MREIIQLEFEEKKRSSEVVEKLIPTIDHYRSEGRSLSSIHAALCDKQMLDIGHSSQMAFNTFKNVYYQQRKPTSNATSAAKPNRRFTHSDITATAADTPSETQLDKTEALRSRAAMFREKIEEHQRRALLDFRD